MEATEADSGSTTAGSAGRRRLSLSAGRARLGRIRGGQQTNDTSLILLDILLSDKHDNSMKKNPAAQALGKLGGNARAKALSAAELSEIAKKGAKARSKNLTAAQRSEIARKAVEARIAKHGQRKQKGESK